MDIVLVEPEIPHNTGAVGRLCLALDATLHLVEPLGFSLDEKAVRRAGLDYWKDVKKQLWPDWHRIESHFGGRRLVLATTKASQAHWDHQFQSDDVLVFGKETAGLSQEIRERHPHHQVKIPMSHASTRSLNLSTSVGIIAYEFARQLTVNREGSQLAG